MGKSDHSVVTFTFHCYLDFTKAKESYAYAKGDYVSMRNELENSNWLRTYTALNEQTSTENKNNPKRIWSHTKRNLKRKSGVAPLLANVEDNDSLKFDDTEKANILQKQFSNVYTREPDGDIPTFESRSESSITNLYVREEMVRKKLKHLNAIKFCGPDEMHPRLIKELAEQLSGPIAHLFNMTIDQQTLPNDWKQALVSPIFKKGSKCLVVNYKPLNLTSVFYKVIETFIKEKFMSHLEEQELLSKKQNGFISGRSTTIQLFNYLDQSIQTIVDGGVVDTIYLDFAKAFDTVQHNRLLAKLHAYGIRGKMLNWISEFIRGRSQEVIVNGAKSETAPVLSGIPQGTVSTFRHLY